MVIDLSGIIEFFYNIWNSVISFLSGMLPQSPVSEYISYFSSLPYLGYINWFIPVGTCVQIMGAWLVAIAMYYIVSALLRWAKLIS